MSQVSQATALLVIDVQLGMFGEWDPPFDPPYNGAQLLTTIGDLIERARAAGTPVIYVQHCGGSGHPLEPEGPGFPIHPTIAPRDDEPVVQKRHPDAFQETTLQRELETRGIQSLVICGLQTEYCIDTTSRRAYSLGYEVTLTSDGHSTWPTPELSAAQIIAHHNQTLDEQFAAVRPAAHISFAPAYLLV